MNLKVGTAIDDDDRLNEAKKESFVLRQIPPPYLFQLSSSLLLKSLRTLKSY